MRCLIADDHPLMRQALKATLLSQWPDALVDEASSYPRAWLLGHCADLCLVDLAMPGADPATGIAQLRSAAPDARILVITGLTEPELLDRVRSCGIAGIISKMAGTADMIAAVEQALDGLDIAPARQPLPPRRKAVLALMSDGLTNKEIAARLSIAPATVKIHVARIIHDLGASNRTDAVSRAQKRGLI